MGVDRQQAPNRPARDGLEFDDVADAQPRELFGRRRHRLSGAVGLAFVGNAPGVFDRHGAGPEVHRVDFADRGARRGGRRRIPVHWRQLERRCRGRALTLGLAGAEGEYRGDEEKQALHGWPRILGWQSIADQIASAHRSANGFFQDDQQLETDEEQRGGEGTVLDLMRFDQQLFRHQVEQGNQRERKQPAE